MAQAIPMIAMAAGSVIKGVGGMKAGNANARALNREARGTELQGVAEEARVRDAARASMGEQIAAQFANGMQGGTGSALDALRESKVNAALDILEIRRQANARAMELRAQGRQQKRQGRFALVEGLIGAGSSIASANADWADARRGQTGGAG